MHGLVACYPNNVILKYKEARRRLKIAVNLLLMDISDASSIQDMFSWNVMTPYYLEDVTYTKEYFELRTDTLGVSTSLYIQSLFQKNWNNFRERPLIHDQETFDPTNISKKRVYGQVCVHKNC